MAPVLRVEVCLALPQRAWRVALELAPGARLSDALRAAAPVLQSGGAPATHLDAPAPARWAVGVHGRLRAPDWPLRDGDRVELYRPLEVDPKVARRRRARQPRAAVNV